jgi:hypothetical protein
MKGEAQNRFGWEKIWPQEFTAWTLASNSRADHTSKSSGR